MACSQDLFLSDVLYLIQFLTFGASHDHYWIEIKSVSYYSLKDFTTFDQLIHRLHYDYFCDDPHRSDLGSYVIYLFRNCFSNSNLAYLEPDPWYHLIALSAPSCHLHHLQLMIADGSPNSMNCCLDFALSQILLLTSYLDSLISLPLTPFNVLESSFHIYVKICEFWYCLSNVMNICYQRIECVLLFLNRCNLVFSRKFHV